MLKTNSVSLRAVFAVDFFGPFSMLWKYKLQS